MLEQIEILRIAHAERDARIHFSPLGNRRTFLKIPGPNAVVRTIDRPGCQREQAHLLAARLRMLEIDPADAALVGHPVARQHFGVAVGVSQEVPAVALARR